MCRPVVTLSSTFGFELQGNNAAVESLCCHQFCPQSCLAISGEIACGQCCRQILFCQSFLLSITTNLVPTILPNLYPMCVLKNETPVSSIAR